MRRRFPHRILQGVRSGWPALLTLLLLVGAPPSVPAQRDQEGREPENPNAEREAADQNRRERRQAARSAGRSGDGGERRRAPDRGRRQSGGNQSQAQGSGGFVTSDSLDAMADPDMVVLYLDPPSITVAEGEDFETTLTLSNPSNRPFDQLLVALRFNDAVLNPIGQSRGSALASELNFDVRLIPEEGLVVLEALFDEPRSDARLEIIDIIWEARREIDAAHLDFPAGEAFRSFIGRRDGANVLGSPVRGEASGLIGAEVRILPGLAALGVNASGEIALPWEDDGDVQDERDHGVEMALVPRVGDPSTGVFDVDVALHNPDGAFADDVALFIRFDPDVLEVIDTHHDNWIENGTNIWDGGYHDRYPFDIHMQNEADNLFGTIRYRMGFFEPAPLSSGILASIRFRAKRGGERARLELDPDRTRVRSMGFDVMGDPESDDDGIHGAILIIPENLAFIDESLAGDLR